MDLRINIIGVSGCGKTTFSKGLAARLKIPRIEMDSLYWSPEGEAYSEEVFLQKLHHTIIYPTWILDGNFDQVTALKWQRTNFVIWLDYSFPRVFYHLLKRWFSKDRARHPGLLESLRSYKGLKERYQAKMAMPEYAHIKFLRIHNPHEAKDILGLLS